MLLLIDNYDSFTYNLYQYLAELGEVPEVYRNDKLTIEDIEAMQPDRIVISPGPCTPREAGEIMHGKISRINHDGRGVFEGVENPFDAIRYHSLVILTHTVPARLDITAWTDNGLVMGVRHKTHPVEGIQFPRVDHDQGREGAAGQLAAAVGGLQRRQPTGRHGLTCNRRHRSP